MIAFFDYIFYRIADSKYYQFVDPKDAWIWGWGLLSTCEYLNACSVIMGLIVLLKINITVNTVLILCIALPIYLINLLKYNEKKYKMLKKIYKVEPKRKIKGIAVFSYIIGSIALYIVVCFFI